MDERWDIYLMKPRIVALLYRSNRSSAMNEKDVRDMSLHCHDFYCNIINKVACFHPTKGEDMKQIRY